MLTDTKHGASANRLAYYWEIHRLGFSFPHQKPRNGKAFPQRNLMWGPEGLNYRDNPISNPGTWLVHRLGFGSPLTTPRLGRAGRPRLLKIYQPGKNQNTPESIRQPGRAFLHRAPRYGSDGD